MSDDKGKGVDKPKRMDVAPIEDPPKPIITSYKERWEAKAAAGAEEARNQLRGQQVRAVQLAGNLQEAKNNLDLEVSKGDNIEAYKELDREEIASEVQETKNRRARALADSNAVLAEAESIREGHKAATSAAKTRQLEEELKQKRLRAKLRGQEMDVDDELEELADREVQLTEQIDELETKLQPMLLQEGTRAKRDADRVRKDIKDLEIELGAVRARMKELQDDE